MKKSANFCALAVICLLSADCANQLHSVVSPNYRSKITPVSAIALTGEGASIAVPAFVAKGYKVQDIATGSGDPIELAKNKHIPFLASVDRVGTDEAVWNGFFKYSMRVTDTNNRNIVWSADGKYGQAGILINQVESNNTAMSEMVEKFSECFAPR